MESRRDTGDVRHLDRRRIWSPSVRRGPGGCRRVSDGGWGGGSLVGRTSSQWWTTGVSTRVERVGVRSPTPTHRWGVVRGLSQGVLPLPSLTEVVLAPEALRWGVGGRLGRTRLARSTSSERMGVPPVGVVSGPVRTVLFAPVSTQTTPRPRSLTPTPVLGPSV